MRFSLGLPVMRHPIPAEFLTADAVRAVAQAAERSGFDSVFVTDHPAPTDRWLQSGGHDALDPFVALGFAAAATQRLRLLSSLTVAGYRNPFVLAKAVATLDRLSGGRVTLGIGAGYLKGEFAAQGVDFERRNELFDESLEVMRLCWSGEPVVWQGPSVSARGNTCLPTPLQDPVPVWIGGNSRLARRRAVLHAQGWMPMPNPAAFAAARRSPVLEGPDDLRRMLAQVAETAASAGRTTPLEVAFTVLEGGTPGSPGFDPAAHLDALAAYADAGVTATTVNVAGDSVAEVVEAAEAYGASVISGHGISGPAGQ